MEIIKEHTNEMNYNSQPALSEEIERKLAEADQAAALTDLRYTAKGVFGRARKRIDE